MIDSIWRRAYDAWQKSGLTRRAFHQTHISTFFPEQPPCIWTLYKKFQQIERLIEAEAVSRIQNAGTVAVVELPSVPVRASKPSRISTIPKKPVPIVRPQRCSNRSAREVRLKLPNGTLLEFTSESPELLAIGMMQAAGGSS